MDILPAKHTGLNEDALPAERPSSSMANPLVFHRFSQLPPELRLAVWGYFSLSSEPAVHQFDDHRMQSAYLIESALIPATRTLMQVSREARDAVLKKRQCIKAGVFHATECFHPGGRWQGRWWAGAFVDWEKDLFFFRESSNPLYDASHAPPSWRPE
ncbi:Uu.00g023460.m01.CDS01 [Anthostomella pinea]|uniref:Uu.00g023460.m01.CDS01 n=1 Tax=Anthostomella pinea TaxID=933095 RepID=A0AAI8W048_9PEZI|nr:Uu.00g023460.m01.CDS01 [Anthostomella pinea]